VAASYSTDLTSSELAFPPQESYSKTKMSEGDKSLCHENACLPKVDHLGLSDPDVGRTDEERAAEVRVNLLHLPLHVLPTVRLTTLDRIVDSFGN
jgi:hypothetical protein